MNVSSGMLGKSCLILQGSRSLAGIHTRAKPAEVINRGVGGMACVPAGFSHARPNFEPNIPRPFFVFPISAASNLKPTEETRDLQTGKDLPHLGWNSTQIRKWIYGREKDILLVCHDF